MNVSKIQYGRYGLLLAVAAIISLSGCKKKDDPIVPTPDPEVKFTSYTLNAKDVLGISGKVTFTQKSAMETVIDIALNGVTTGTHPAHIHSNSAIETGGIVISLNNVDETGKSSTIITKKDNGDGISYDQLINFDGYLNVHESALALGSIMAQGDIGGNVLTGDNKSYNLNGSLGVSGTFKIEKRKNGTTLATVMLTGTVNGDSYPAHIHTGSITTLTPDVVVVELSNIPGTTGASAQSMTQIRKKKDGSDISYDDLLKYTGYVDVHRSSLDPTVIALGNIGSNQP